MGYPRWLAALIYRLTGLHFVEMQYGGRHYVFRVRVAPAGYRYIRVIGNTFILNPDGTIPNHYCGYVGFTFDVTNQRRAA